MNNSQCLPSRLFKGLSGALAAALLLIACLPATGWTTPRAYLLPACMVESSALATVSIILGVPPEPAMTTQNDSPEPVRTFGGSLTQALLDDAAQQYAAQVTLGEVIAQKHVRSYLQAEGMNGDWAHALMADIQHGHYRSTPAVLTILQALAAQSPVTEVSGK